MYPVEVYPICGENRNGSVRSIQQATIDESCDCNECAACIDCAACNDGGACCDLTAYDDNGVARYSLLILSFFCAVRFSYSILRTLIGNSKIAQLSF